MDITTSPLTDGEFLSRAGLFYKVTLLRRDDIPRLSAWMKKSTCFHKSIFWRRERDSNPRVLAHKLISSQPRYDHFDISPNINLIKI